MSDALAVRHYGPAHGSHTHDHFQVLFGLHGVLELEVEGRGRRVTPGEGCVIAPGERHDFEGDGDAQCLVLDTHANGWGQLVGQPLPAAAAPLAQYLAHACEAGRPSARMHGATLLLEACSPIHTARPRARRPIDWVALGTWARAQAHRNLDVAELAARVHLSPAQFTLRMREALGQSPMAWLRSLRLDQALALRQSGLGSAETARRTGYRSASALGAALRRYSGR